MMKNYRVVDNFLSSVEHRYIVSNTLKNSYSFNLYLNESVSGVPKSKSDGIYFTHTFLEEDDINSPFFEYLYPIIEKINPKKLLRVRLNLYPKTFFIKKHNWHIDFNFSHKGFIYYLNTNNGSTDIKNNFLHHKIKSVENRALFFDSSKKHRSTTCTDKDYRSNIIINYI